MKPAAIRHGHRQVRGVAGIRARDAGGAFLRRRCVWLAEWCRITFAPHSKWIVNAILAWTVADEAAVRRDVIGPFEEWTFRMPPQEWAKWKADPVRTEVMPPLSAADQRRGFMVYSRHYLECIFPETRPREDGLNPALRIFASPGEYATTNFVVLPLVALRDATVSVSVSGPVPAANIDVRHVRFMRARPNYTVQYRYRVVPDVLEHFDALEIGAEENARFWLTLRIPNEAPAGHYNGKVTFTSSGGIASIPLQLRILPIQLHEDPTKVFGVYYRHPYDQMATAPDERSKEYFRRKA